MHRLLQSTSSGVGQSKLYDNAESGVSRTASLSGGRISSFLGGDSSIPTPN